MDLIDIPVTAILQKEIHTVITKAGLTPDPCDWSQLHQAIGRIAGGERVRLEDAVFASCVADGDVVYWTGQLFDRALADGTAKQKALGIADVTRAEVTLFGRHMAGIAGLTPGEHYLSATVAGALDPAGSPVKVGFATGADAFLVDIDGIPAEEAPEPVPYPFLCNRGDGSHGAMSFTSGAHSLSGGLYNATTLDVAAGATLTLEASAESVVIRCSGRATIAGDIVVSGDTSSAAQQFPKMSGSGGGCGGGSDNGNAGVSTYGAAGGTSSGTNPVDGGNGVAVGPQAETFALAMLPQISGGGHGGGSNVHPSTHPGRVIIIVAEEIDFTGGIDASGANGVDSNGAPGGAGGGIIVMAAKTWIADTGTRDVSGGTGGTGLSGSGSGGTGGNGWTYTATPNC